MSDHDNSYKNIFSHTVMVRDLLTGFVPEPWLAELNLDTLEKVSGSYVTDDLRDREDDIIWRVRFHDHWLYLYILLEFQSSVDAFMAVRVLTYVGLLYQDIIKQDLLTPNRKLPPVLPIVLYNGKYRWQAATDLSQLIEHPPGRLSDFTPKLSYLLLDEGRIDESGPFALKNLAAALFSLEKGRTAQTLLQTLAALIEWLDDSEQSSLRRAFTVWIKRVLLPARLPGVTLPELGNLLEIKTMLAETVVEWTQQWKQEGLQEGRHEGKIEGGSNMLARLLTKRFGPLPDDIRIRLSSATVDQLEHWADALLDAPTLTAVFVSH